MDGSRNDGLLQATSDEDEPRPKPIPFTSRPASAAVAAIHRFMSDGAMLRVGVRSVCTLQRGELSVTMRWVTDSSNTHH